MCKQRRYHLFSCSLNYLMFILMNRYLCRQLAMFVDVMCLCCSGSVIQVWVTLLNNPLLYVIMGILTIVGWDPNKNGQFK